MNSSLNLGSPASRRTSSPSPFGTLNVPGNQAFSTPATHRAPLPISNNEGGPYLGPPASALGRRVSVSAESIEPSTGPEIPPPFYYKTPEQVKRLQDSIANAFLFRNLDDKKRKAVLGAMKEMKFDKNVRVITQGDAGDYFYVVDSGELDCFVKPKVEEHPAYPGAPPPPPPAPAQPDDHPEYGKKVFHYTKGTSFGELALMYSTPRAATIISTTPVTLWALDRVTFKTILLEISSRTRKDYESFLRSVDILQALTDRERAKLADVLQPREFEYGEAVVNQGEIGKEFYIVEEGEATVSKKVEGKEEEDIVMHLKRGDYFGGLCSLHVLPCSIVTDAISRPFSNRTCFAPSRSTSSYRPFRQHHRDTRGRRETKTQGRCPRCRCIHPFAWTSTRAHGKNCGSQVHDRRSNSVKGARHCDFTYTEVKLSQLHDVE